LERKFSYIKVPSGSENSRVILQKSSSLSAAGRDASSPKARLAAAVSTGKSPGADGGENGRGGAGAFAGLQKKRAATKARNAPANTLARLFIAEIIRQIHAIPCTDIFQEAC
jgi:hypothetical protein